MFLVVTYVDLRSARVIARAGQLDLNAVNAVDAVNKQNQDEYEGYLSWHQQMMLL
jgi:hypothetical protein